jgi:hypothetical protein
VHNKPMNPPLLRRRLWAVRQPSADPQVRLHVRRYRAKSTGRLLEANWLISLGWLFTFSAAGCAVESG